ncbi:DUF3471 domain-containing protein [Paenibacillus sp. 2KB_20]|uniref:DUF3471 domain-containing protein n=1 Tax=Paenibacillus sp. 2KB_20 TaxID=3232977 RepID=UPI003F993A42
MVSHGGNIDGFTAHVAFIPTEKIGVVVLSNLNGTPLPVFIANYIFDSLLGGEIKDWSGQALGQKKEATVANEPATNSKATSGAKEPIVPLSSSLLDLTGTYVHAAYGEMMVELTDGELRAGFNSMKFPLTHQNANQFELHVTEFDIKTKATFLTDSNGNVDRLSVILLFEPGAKEIEFVRIESRSE